MSANTIEAIESTVQKTHIWLKELTEDGRFTTVQQAYSALRGVLHALRDRLVPEEAVQLAAELPMLIRGMYYEGWKPSRTPAPIRSRGEFLEAIRNNLGNNRDIDPFHAAQAVFQLMERKISCGEIRDVRRMLPEHLQELWPAIPSIV